MRSTTIPGLADDFQSNRIVLWEQGDERAIWVPMFRTVDGRTLWVGRPVDDEPLQVFRTEIVLRVLLIVLGLVVFQFIVARWITRRAERIGSDLTEGVQKTLESDQPVVFDWSGSPELRQLADDLTRLSRTHASQTRNLRAHARELEATNRYKSRVSGQCQPRAAYPAQFDPAAVQAAGVQGASGSTKSRVSRPR